MSSRGNRVEFTNAAGRRLVGSLETPVGRPLGWALFAHCFTCGKDLRPSQRIAAALAKHGIGTLRFDFTGLGESEGSFAESTFGRNVDDLVSAAGWMREHDRAPSLLVGHSLGGTGAISAARKIEGVRAVATIGAPSNPSHVLSSIDVDATESAKGEVEVDIGGRPFCISNDFVEDLSHHPLTDQLPELKAALLILHAPLDETVSIDHASELFLAARHPKSFVSLDDSDHLLTKPANADRAGSIVAAWAASYLSEGQVVSAVHRDDVEVFTGEGFGTDVVVNDRHRLRVDEPESIGGADTGPTPYDLLSTALGACTSMTLRMYADRKGWPLESVRVHVRHGRVHAKDCEECESTGGSVDRFERVIDLAGPLDTEQRDRLLEIADRCPVHRTLHGEVIVETSLSR